MTAKEMQRRNGRAQQLRVIQVEEGHYFVESSDGKVAYKAMLTDDKTFCTCLDYQKNQQGPDFRCKHLLAILNCLPADSAQKKEFLAKRQPPERERERLAILIHEWRNESWRPFERCGWMEESEAERHDCYDLADRIFSALYPKEASHE